MLDHMTTLFLVFGGTSIVFSIAAVPIYNTTNDARGAPFLQPKIVSKQTSKPTSLEEHSRR